MKDETPPAETSRGGWNPDEHPAPEKLSAYQAKELPAAENDAIQEHLAHCEICAEVLLDLHHFLDFVPEEQSPKEVVDFEAVAEWRELRKKLRDDRLLKSLRAFQAVAAVLGILVFGLSIYAIRLHGRSPALQPLPEKTLDFSEHRGVQTVKDEARLPVALKLFFDNDYPRYQVEIRARGSQLLYVNEYKKSDLDRSILTLPAGSLPAGTYTIRLFGLDDGEPEPVGLPNELTILP